MDVETVSFVITMLGIGVAVAIGLIQFRNLVKTRQIELYLDLYNQVMEKDLGRWLVEVSMLWKWKDTKQFFEKYGPEKNVDGFLKFMGVTSYLEHGARLEGKTSECSHGSLSDWGCDSRLLGEI